jgi:nitrate/nitrite transporter NarK
MSLKAFHVVFIALSILMAFGCGVWLLHDYVDTRSAAELVVGIISLLGGLGLVAYGKSVLRKLKHISYL